MEFVPKHTGDVKIISENEALGVLRRTTYEDNIKVDLRELGYDDVDWIPVVVQNSANESVGGGSWFKLLGHGARLCCVCFCLSRWYLYLSIVQISLSYQAQVILQLRVWAGQNYFFFCTPIQISYKDF